VTNIDFAIMHLQNTLSTIYTDTPCGIIRRDCREAILDAYDRLRKKYQATEDDVDKS